MERLLLFRMALLVFGLSSILNVGCKSSSAEEQTSTGTPDLSEAPPKEITETDRKADGCTVSDVAEGVKIECGSTSAILKHGTPGANGAAGIPGAPGAVGSSGASGATGPQGERGPAGSSANGGALRLVDGNGNVVGDFLEDSSPYAVTVWDSDSQALYEYGFAEGGLASGVNGLYFTTADCSGSGYSSGLYSRAFKDSQNKIYRVLNQPVAGDFKYYRSFSGSCRLATEATASAGIKTGYPIQEILNGLPAQLSLPLKIEFR